MVCIELQHGEKRQQSRAADAPAAVEHQQAAYCRGDIAQSKEFPDVSRSYYYYEIGRKAPCHGAYERIVPPQSQTIEQDKESEHHHEHQVRRSREPQAVDAVEPCEKAVRRVCGRNLERRHTGEQGVGPQCFLSGAFFPLPCFFAVGGSLLHVVLHQHIAFKSVGVEERAGNYGHYGHRYEKAPHLRPA